MTGINVKTEYSLVCKQNKDCLGVVVNFDQFNDLPFDLWEAVVT
jgi:hypothetical protein